MSRKTSKDERERLAHDLLLDLQEHVAEWKRYGEKIAGKLEVVESQELYRLGEPHFRTFEDYLGYLGLTREDYDRLRGAIVWNPLRHP